MQNIVTLGEINDALKIAAVTAAQLADMGFAALANKPICEGLPPEESRRLRNAKLYPAESIGQIRVALAQRFAEPAAVAARQLEPKPAFYTAIAEDDGKWLPLPEYSSQTSDGVLRLVLERAHAEGYRGGNALERLKELGWAYRPVYFAVDPAQVAPLPLLVRDIAREIGITGSEACRALKDLGNFSVNTAVTAEMALKLRELFPAPQAAPAAVAVSDDRWCPDVCPITGRKFFMWVTHHDTDADVPTYGGPFDSYTIPVKDEDGSYSCERYDHDFGGWREWEDVGLTIVDDQSFVVDPDNSRYDEIRDFAEGRAALAATPAAAAPVVLPEPDATVSELMRLVESYADAVASDMELQYEALEISIKSKLHALLAGVSAPAAVPVEPIAYLRPAATLPEFGGLQVWKNDGSAFPVFAAPQAQADARDDSALLDAMELQRIAVVPEYEGPWDAEIYNDEGQPNHRGSGSTPREAIRAASAAAKGE